MPYDPPVAVDKEALKLPEPQRAYDIAKVVRVLMQLTDTSLDDLAAALGVAKSSASARLNGHTRFLADDVADLATLFQVEPGLFFLPMEKVKERLRSVTVGKHLELVSSGPGDPRIPPKSPLVRSVRS